MSDDSYIQTENEYSLDDIFSNIKIEGDKLKNEKTRLPFKFLDAYTLEDKGIFFGRDNEIEELDRKFYRSKILLVYGKSGTGKSSIINCGLLSKIPSSDILKMIVRCGNKAHSNLVTELKKYSKEDTNDVVKLTEDIYYQKYKPITIIFDQFEEVFILSDNHERQLLLQDIQKFLNSKLNIKLIFIIREEYYANLTEFENEIPELYSNKLRIEQMDKLNVKQAIEKPCEICNVKIEEGLSETIIEQLTSQTGRLELTWFQVIMDKLYKIAVERNSETPKLQLKDLKELGRIDNILSAFLDDQLKLMKNGEAGEAVLKTMVSGDGTKKQLRVEEIKLGLKSMGKSIDEEEIKQIIRHFVNVRILTDKNEQGLYELRHDSLAAKIYEKITVVEKELLEVKQFIENAFNNYKKRKVLLNPDDLKYIAPFEERLYLNKQIENFVAKSKMEIEKVGRKKKRILLSISSILIVGLVLLSVYFYLGKKASDLEARISKSNEIAGIAMELIDENPTKAFLLAEKAYQIYETDYAIKAIYNSYKNAPFIKNVNSKRFTISPNKEFVVSSPDYQNIYLYNFKGELIAKVNNNSIADYINFRFTDNQKYIIARNFKTKTIYDIKLKKLIEFDDSKFIKLEILKSNKEANEQIFVLRENYYRIYNFKKEILFEQSFKSPITDFTYKEDFLATLHADSTLKIWDIKNRTLIHKLKNNKDIASLEAINPKRKLIILKGDKQYIYNWINKQFANIQIRKIYHSTSHFIIDSKIPDWGYNVEIFNWEGEYLGSDDDYKLINDSLIIINEQNYCKLISSDSEVKLPGKLAGYNKAQNKIYTFQKNELNENKLLAYNLKGNLIHEIQTEIKKLDGILSNLNAFYALEKDEFKFYNHKLELIYSIKNKSNNTFLYNLSKSYILLNIEDSRAGFSFFKDSGKLISYTKFYNRRF